MLKTKIELYNEIKSLSDIFSEINKIKLKKEEKLKFDQLNYDLVNWSSRLKDERFKVALVGTTSAGKSTFANALLNKDLLPEDDKTTTFTSASIEASDTDKATVEFYTTNEFVNKFNKLLRDVEIFDYDYYTINQNLLQEILKDKKEYIKGHANIKEINAILETKNEIEEFLDRDMITFNDVIKVHLKEYITNPEIARAVKRINIQSTQFKNMDNLIIYDVPGFDSPTKLHREQAEKFMKDSEIIVMVHGYGANSDLNDSQVTMLATTKDEFGTELAKKMLVVGNKIDYYIESSRESSLEKIKKVSNDTIDSLKKWNVYQNGNFIPISAKAYMQEHLLIDGNEINQKLKQFNLSNNIDTFRKRLEEVFKTDALEVLNTVVNKVIYETKAFLEEFKLNYNPNKDQKKKRSEVFKLVDKQWSNVKKSLKQDLKDYKNEVRNTNFDLDNAIREQVETQWIEKLKNQIDDLIREAQSDTTTGKENIISPSQVNDKVRTSIYNVSLTDIINISTASIEKLANKEISKLYDILQKNILGNSVSADSADELKSTLHEITVGHFYEAKSYKPLIFRFLNNIFEVIILNKVTNNEKESRVENFNRYLPNIEGLIYINQMFNDLQSTYEQTLIQKILIQNKNIKIASKDPLPELLSHAKVAQTIDDVKLEIITDLDNLKEIFNDVILNAIQIESPFKDSLSDQIQAVFKDLDELESSKLRDIVVKYIESIAAKDYADLIIDEQLSEKLSAIILKIDAINK